MMCLILWLHWIMGCEHLWLINCAKSTRMTMCSLTVWRLGQEKLAWCETATMGLSVVFSDRHLDKSSSFSGQIKHKDGDRAKRERQKRSRQWRWRGKKRHKVSHTVYKVFRQEGWACSCVSRWWGWGWRSWKKKQKRENPPKKNKMPVRFKITLKLPWHLKKKIIYSLVFE